MLIVFKVCQILTVLPASSTNCEREFSTVGNVKIYDWSNLEGDHLESSIRISLADMNEIKMESHCQELLQR